MADPAKPPNLMEMAQQWVVEHFGTLGTVVIFVVGVGFYVWSNWDKVRRRPGVAPLLRLLRLLRRRKIPRADPQRFSILVALLENDPDREHQRLIIEGLKEFEGVQVLPLDRTIAVDGMDPEEQERRGHANAQNFLRKRGAEVVLWGTVLKLGGRSVPKLHWSTAAGAALRPARYSPLAEADLRLPELFWADLSVVLRLVVATHAEGFHGSTGHYVADRLRPFIAAVDKLLTSSVDRPGWDPNATGLTRVTLAYALSVLGEQAGQSKPLMDAIGHYRQALNELTRERMPLDWAMTQNNLGNAHFQMAVLSWSTGECEQAIAQFDNAANAYRAALEEFDRVREPPRWGAAKNNLGNVLARLSEHTGDAALLRQAVAAYCEALKVRRRARVPFDWAETRCNLGNALHTMYELEHCARRLHQARAAYIAALQVYTRDHQPLRWADTRNNLSLTLLRLGQHVGDPELLREALDCLKDAREVFVDEAGQTHRKEEFKQKIAAVKAARRDLSPGG